MTPGEPSRVVDSRRTLAAALKARARAEKERDQLRAEVERVRALHVSTTRGTWCRQCGSNWPCRTIAALGETTGAGTGQEAGRTPASSPSPANPGKEPPPTPQTPPNTGVRT